MNYFNFSKILSTKVLNICISPLEVIQLIYILYVNTLHGKESGCVLFYLQVSQNKPFQVLGLSGSWSGLVLLYRLETVLCYVFSGILILC